jgi:hypothetical protein
VEPPRAAQQVLLPTPFAWTNLTFPSHPTLTASTLARKAYDDAEHSLKLTREEKQRAVEDYADLFDVDGYGAQGEWKKLQGLCLEKDTGEYVSFSIL